ncbi:DUF3533 domain-containing protein [Pseudoclavibacter sp. 13-3]|uniref:DUF3533 domain-containing protein n=1 Tax=Pseudoclavibacter sp. 13-3 TaxID=2901228 RepID=UPI001E4A1224|nr:DUF3533 domain-containing protein [Pseudoclavibacter sp. 13-3]MCD7100698.1 SNG1 family protein [Pseudoclavibacter sp. 13-3]
MPTHSTPKPPAHRGPLMWAAPTVVVSIVMAVLAFMYLASNINAADNLHDFPIAVVDQDSGTTLADGEHFDAGAQIAQGIVDGIDSDQFSVAEITLDEAQQRMSAGDLYAAIVLPDDLSQQLTAWGAGTLSATPVTQPSATVLVNPRNGSGGASIGTRVGEQALAQANSALGKQLTTVVEQQSAALQTSLTGTAQAALAQPLHVDVQMYNPLPSGTGDGLAAFFFALLLVLAGFTGSMAASTVIDSMLGATPSEMGPAYGFQPFAGLSRLRTLALKWGVMTLISLVVATLFVIISQAVGMPVDHPWTLWCLSLLMILAVSLVAQTVQALLGSAGLLLNLFIFIILGLPSSGGTVPLEALPGFFRWLAGFEPLHQIYVGVRSVLFYDAAWDAGLGHAVVTGSSAIVVALIIGVVGMRFYDRHGDSRNPRLALAAAAL